MYYMHHACMCIVYYVYTDKQASNIKDAHLGPLLLGGKNVFKANRFIIAVLLCTWNDSGWNYKLLVYYRANIC